MLVLRYSADFFLVGLGCWISGLVVTLVFFWILGGLDGGCLVLGCDWWRCFWFYNPGLLGGRLVTLMGGLWWVCGWFWFWIMGVGFGYRIGGGCCMG